jgi:hypothetical protein
MKIALCFCGQIRSFQKGFEYYKSNLLEHYDVDVYIHSWLPKNEEVLSLYKPVSHSFVSQPEGNFNDIYTNTPNAQKHPPKFTYNMLLSMYMVSKMLKTKYDWVIKSRTDYALNVKIPFSELDNSKLYIPNCRMVPERDFGNDQFAFGSQSTMNKYMSTFLYIDEYYKAGNQFIGEDMMRANLHKHNLHGENLVYVNMQNPFPPGPHNGTWHSLIRDDYEQWKNN